MKLPFLPQRRGDEIQRARLPDKPPEMPREWLEPVSYSNTLAEFKSALISRLSKRDRAKKAFNISIGIASNLLRLPELKLLQIETLNLRKNMNDIDVGKKIKLIVDADGWEAGVWLVVAIAGILAGILQGEPALIAGAVAAGIKSAFQFYKSKKVPED